MSTKIPSPVTEKLYRYLYQSLRQERSNHTLPCGPHGQLAPGKLIKCPMSTRDPPVNQTLPHGPHGKFDHV